MKSIMSLENFVLEPGKITILKGKNGAGKTSVVEAIKGAFGGGNDATLIRNGYDKGETVILFDDDSEIRKVFNRNGRSRPAQFKSNGVLQGGQSMVDEVYDPFASNPIAIIEADKNKRKELILESIPLKCSKDDLEFIFGAAVNTFPDDIFEGHALETISKIEERVRVFRRDANSGAKEAKSTIESLQKSLPEVDVEDIGAEIESLETQIKTNKEQFDRKVNELRRITLEKLEMLDEEYLKAKEELERNREKARNEMKAEEDKVIKTIRDNFEIANRDHEPRLAALREQEKEKARYENTKSIIEQQASKLSGYLKKAESYNEALKSLTGFKEELLSDLPIPGLDVRDGDIFYNDVPFERVNTAELIKLCAEIATMRAKKQKLEFIFIDGFERLDSENQRIFIDEFKKTDLQLLVTQVTSDEQLKIELV